VGATAGSMYYVKVTGADATAFGTGRYGLVLNFGPYATPILSGPITQTLNGNPIQAGGGLAEKTDDDGDGKGFDKFGAADKKAAAVTDGTSATRSISPKLAAFYLQEAAQSLGLNDSIQGVDLRSVQATDNFWAAAESSISSARSADGQSAAF